MNPSLQNVLTRYRGWIIFLFALPVSFVVLRCQDLRNWIHRHFLATGRHHERRVAEIQARVRESRRRGRKMCTARKPWKTMSIRCAEFKREMDQIPVNLKNVLAIDPDRMVVNVEPMVTMGELTRELTPRGYALAVQPEMDDLTVGGLCLGVGIETSSHRCGFLFETVEAYEVVLASGERVRATESEHADLFHALPWSHGTLGFLVSVELRIVPVKRHMRLRYLPCRTTDEFCERISDLARARDAPSYLEGLAFQGGGGVVMCGEFEDPDTPEKRGRINAINRWYKPWFHVHVEKLLDEGLEREEFIPTRHYYHRHTPSVFFQLKDLIPFSDRAWYRWLFGWLGAPRVSLMKLSLTRELRRQSMQNRVAQDIIIPIDDLGEGIEWARRRLGISPLWICPVRITDQGEREGFLRNPARVEEGTNYGIYVDLGVYGIPQAVRDGEPWNAVETGRELEAWTRGKGGYHMLYADTFMSRSEFEEMFCHENYRKVRQQVDAIDAFPEVYDKVIPEAWLLDSPDEDETSDELVT